MQSSAKFEDAAGGTESLPLTLFLWGRIIHEVQKEKGEGENEERCEVRGIMFAHGTD